MVTLISICYIVLVMVAFKVIKIPVNPSSVATSIGIGVIILGSIVIGWKFAAPMTEQLTIKRNTVQLAVMSKELIEKVHVGVDQPVKKGDLLFEVRTEPFQFAVDQAKAQLSEAQQNVSKLEASVEVASAKVDQSKANEAYTKATVDAALKTQELNPSAVATLKVEAQKQDEVAATAGIEQAVASLHEAQFALAAEKSSIAGLQAQLNTAEYHLEQCHIHAPADGMIVNLQAREGTMTRGFGSAAVGVFMDTTETDVIAIFPQNFLKHVKPEDDVELALKNMPGKIVAGKVDAIVKYSGEGQLLAEGILPIAADLGSKGFLAVRINVNDPEIAKSLPLGGAGALTIYTDFGGAFHAISKITIRMKSWMNYLPI